MPNKSELLWLKMNPNWFALKLIKIDKQFSWSPRLMRTVYIMGTWYVLLIANNQCNDHILHNIDLVSSGRLRVLFKCLEIIHCSHTKLYDVGRLWFSLIYIKTLRHEENGRHLADTIFRCSDFRQWKWNVVSNCHKVCFVRIQSTVSHHLLRKWLGVEQATSR